MSEALDWLIRWTELRDFICAVLTASCNAVTWIAIERSQMQIWPHELKCGLKPITRNNLNQMKVQEAEDRNDPYLQT